MSLLGRLLVSSERYVGPHAAKLLHRRHTRTLDDASVSEEDERRARDSWWGGDPQWFPGGTPPRQHNRITPLIDGASFFERLHAAIAGARHYVYISGWCVTPHVPLLRNGYEQAQESRLVRTLSAAAERVPVRLLVWGGAFAFIRPTRSDVEESLATLRAEVSGDFVCAADDTAHFTHCHHQKMVVVDGELAFVGGIDLTTYSGDRWDINAHPLRSSVNWHDVTLLVEGEAVRDVEQSFRQRWMAVTGDGSLPRRTAAANPCWSTPAQVVQTIPKGTYAFAPRGEFGIHHAYVEAIRNAREFIYLETQYLWSPEVMDTLLEVLNRPPPMLPRIVVVLPARATSGKWDNDQHVETLRRADAGRRAIEAYTLYSSGPSSGMRPFRYRPTYVHAKVGIFDDEWLIAGSANLNNRGLVTDGELDVIAHDRALASSVRQQLWAEHLNMDPAVVAETDTRDMIDVAWKRKALTNRDIIDRGDRLLPSAVVRYEQGKMPGAWLLEELEELTFEH